MQFEWNSAKNASNKEKHGISFDEARELFEDPNMLEVPSAVELDEERFVCIGRIGSKVYTAVVTYRDENIRIISVRRARKNEEEAYQNES